MYCLILVALRAAVCPRFLTCPCFPFPGISGIGRSLPAAYGRILRPLRESSVEQGHIEIKNEGQVFSGLGIPRTGDVFMIETMAAEGQGAGRMLRTATIGTAAVGSGVSLQGVRGYLSHSYEEMTQQYLDYMPMKIARENEEFFRQPGYSLASCLKEGERIGCDSKSTGPNYSCGLDKETENGKEVFGEVFCAFSEKMRCR